VQLCLSAADGDWLRAGRLAEKARAGDQQAAEELKRMQDTELFEEEDEE